MASLSAHEVLEGEALLSQMQSWSMELLIILGFRKVGITRSFNKNCNLSIVLRRRRREE
jgi:hypothetical protein